MSSGKQLDDPGEPSQGQMASNPISQAAAVETCPDCARKVGASLTDLTCGLTLHLRQAGCGSLFPLRFFFRVLRSGPALCSAYPAGGVEDKGETLLSPSSSPTVGDVAFGDHKTPRDRWSPAGPGVGSGDQGRVGPTQRPRGWRVPTFDSSHTVQCRPLPLGAALSGAGTAGGSHPARWVQSLFPGLAPEKRVISRIRSLGAGSFRGEGLSTATHTDRGAVCTSRLSEPQRCLSIKIRLIKTHCGYFPSGPVVKTSLSSAGHAASIPGQGAKVTCLLAKKPQHRNRSNIVTNSIKT